MNGIFIILVLFLSLIASGTAAKETADKSSVRPTAKSTPVDAVAKYEELQRQRERDIEEVNNEWRAPIDFFGKVVDESNTPVQGAKIRFGWNNLSGSSNRDAVSDDFGSFTLRGEQGKVLTVRVSKEGYYTEKDYPVGFFYAGQNENFVPDPSNPIVFRLKKKGHGEPMTHTSSRIKVPLKGQSIELNLFNGKIVSLGEGHLRLECWSDYDQQPSKRGYDWKLKMSVPNGGIIEAHKVFDFEAPEDGYTPDFEIIMGSSSKDRWQNTIERKFFLKLQDGTFARISFLFIAYNGVFRFDAFLNPSGSRNLEFDPDVQPKQTTFE